MPFTTLTNRGDPSTLRKSRETGTIGAFSVVVPPASGRLPSVLNNQLLCGLPLGSKPGVEYAPLKFGTESIPEMPGSVACCVPFMLAAFGFTRVNFKSLPATSAAVIASASCARTLTALASVARQTTKLIRNHFFNDPQLDSFIWTHPFHLNWYHGDAAEVTRRFSTCQARNINFTFQLRCVCPRPAGLPGAALKL